jgi:hypothetical protein
MVNFENLVVLLHIAFLSGKEKICLRRGAGEPFALLLGGVGGGGVRSY